MRGTRTVQPARTRPEQSEHWIDLNPVERGAARSQIPAATYRLQFSRSFRFEHAIRILDYLHDLGITHVYASPILGSRHGSEHGYDATDPTRIDPDLGSEEDFYAFEQALAGRGMGLVLDIVPNHMAASSENPWWMDVLENGPGSAFASFFDIDWHPGPRRLEGRILLPVLGRPFGEALDAGEIQLLFKGGRLFVRYFESIFPLAPKSYRRVLIHQIDKMKETVGEETEVYQEYSGILAVLASLFRSEPAVPESQAEKRAKFEAVRGRLRQLEAGSSQVQDFIRGNLSAFNGQTGDPGSYSLLEELLSEQYYQLAYWQNINESINYRRFFTITDLVGIRVEDSAVFDATHSLILRLASRTPSAGLRIDHVDGLRDPEGYLQQLREKLRETGSASAGDAYLVVEKILAPEEQLPTSWPVQGTTGYDYLNQANGIFVCTDNAEILDQIYSRFIGKETTFADVVVEKKKLIMSSLLGVEIRALGRQLAELAGDDRYARELPRAELTSALIETTAHLPVYRTYIRTLAVPEDAKFLIERAIAEARAAKPHFCPSCFDFLRDVLLLLAPPHVVSHQREARLAFVMRWQQFTGPIVAKGVEDTALYVYNPLLSLNEVGGNAQVSAASSADGFMAFVAERQARWPHSLNTTTTHDTKRSEDVRARINVLSEIPDQWESCLTRWAELNAPHKRQVNGHSVPDRNEEYFLYQTLLGAYPSDAQPSDALCRRLQEHVVKAMREAMVHSRWTRPNLAHEQALAQFIDSIMCPGKAENFLADFLGFHAAIAFFGMINSLGQTLIKITCPGVPDFYQGSECWDLRLVDPDNRGPVDFERNAKHLDEIRRDRRDNLEQAEELLAKWTDGRAKLWLIEKALHFRGEHWSLLTNGTFQPMTVTGSRSDCVISFVRREGGNLAAVVVSRRLAMAQAPLGRIPPPEFWNDTCLHVPSARSCGWQNALTRQPVAATDSANGSCLKLSDILRHFPVALLTIASDRDRDDAHSRGRSGGG